MRNRPFVEKFETGEYIGEWNGYNPNILGGVIYSENIGIGEDKFFKCVGGFNGIGDVDWWVREEIDKLTDMEVEELNFICGYKTYLKNFITHELILKITNFFECETFNVYRVGNKNIVELCNQMSVFYEKIVNRSVGCLESQLKQNPFKIISFEEYKLKK